MLFIRLTPWLTAILALVAAQYQWTHLFSYPAPLLLWFGWYLLSIFVIRWGKVSFRASLERMTLPVLTAMSAIFGFLMAESTIERVGLTLTLAALSFVTLELFFYYAYDPTHYPVNAFSHINLALVPFILFYTTCGLSGVRLFLQAPWWISVGILVVLGMVLFTLTEHPVADASHRLRWRGLGSWLGVQASLLLIFLPVTASTRGVLIALLFFIPLRIRRYSYAPRPSSRLAWIEGTAAVLIFFTLLLTAQWA